MVIIRDAHAVGYGGYRDLFPAETSKREMGKVRVSRHGGTVPLQAQRLTPAFARNPALMRVPLGAAA